MAYENGVQWLDSRTIEGEFTIVGSRREAARTADEVMLDVATWIGRRISTVLLYAVAVVVNLGLLYWLASYLVQ